MLSPSQNREKEGLRSFAELNSSSTSCDIFVGVFGGLVEHSPFLAAALWHQRPFDSPRAMHDALSQALKQLPQHMQAGLVCCYPDLAGRLARGHQLTEDSTKEHESAGLFDLSDRESEEMARLNEAYKQKFGMPFVICARENKKETILRGLRERSQNSFSEEVKNGIEQICNIAWYRILEMVAPLAAL